VNFAVISRALPGDQAIQVITILRAVVMLSDQAKFPRGVGLT
jgi:hypothetical protein